MIDIIPMTCCTKNWIVTPVLRGHLWNKQTKTDALFVWHASFSFIDWPSTINHLFSDIFFYYILTIVFMTDCNIFTLYLYWLTFMDEWFLVIIQVWFLLWKFHDYWWGKKNIILIIILQEWEITEILSNGISSNIVCEISQSCLTWPAKYWEILQRT